MAKRSELRVRYHFLSQSLPLLLFSCLGNLIHPASEASTADSTLQISNVRVSKVGTTSASVNWNTNLSSNTWIYYGTSTQYGLAASLNTASVSSHQINLSKLTPNTPYHFKVKSVTAAGAMAMSEDHTFVTLSSPSPSPSPSPLPVPTPSGSPGLPTPVPTKLGTSSTDWSVVYNGYGKVTFDPTQGIIMQPETTTSSSITHAALILSNAYLQTPIQNFEISVIVATDQQLRTPNPNPWEVFWLFFNYTSDSTTSDGHKKTNYFVFKPNGIELGTAFDEIGQNYLVTETYPANSIGTLSTITVRKLGQQLWVWINGNLVIQYQGSLFPQALYDLPGTFGLYTEDARVHIYSAAVTPL